MEMRSFQDSNTLVAPLIGQTEEPRRMPPPNPEVPEKKHRRKFTAQFKLRILAEADACEEPGQIGVLLRREGLYSSYLNTWRRQKEKGLLEALSPRKRGRKEKEKNPLTQRVAQLERANEQLRKKLKQAEIIIDVQKKNLTDPGDLSKPSGGGRKQLMNAAYTLSLDVGKSRPVRP